jgi:ribosomal protein S18 acetylase RimI-like enzyme
MIDIRAYVESDEDAVAALWNEIFPSPSPWNEPHAVIRRKLSVQRELFFVAEAAGEIVGTAMGGYDGHRGWIYSVAVSPSYRRAGIGARLMRRVERELRTRGCPKVNLQVRGGNTGAADFYESLGYAVEDRVSMGKPLGDPSDEV